MRDKAGSADGKGGFVALCDEIDYPDDMSVGVLFTQRTQVRESC